MIRILLLLFCGFFVNACNSISDKELRRYWNAYTILNNTIVEIEKDNYKIIKTLEMINFRWSYYITNYEDPYNSLLIQKSKNQEIKIAELLHELEAIKQFGGLRDFKIDSDLDKNVSLTAREKKLVLSCIKKVNHIFPSTLPDSLKNFKWKKRYSNLIEQPIKKVFLLLAIENMKMELLIHHKKVLCYYQKIAKMPPYEIQYKIEMKSTEYKTGDTLKAFFYPLVYNKLKKAVINGKSISIDSQGIGHFTMHKNDIEFTKNGTVKNSFKGAFTVTIGNKDTIIFGNPPVYIRNTK